VVRKLEVESNHIFGNAPPGTPSNYHTADKGFWRFVLTLLDRPTGWFCRRGAADTADVRKVSWRRIGLELSLNRQPRAEGLSGKTPVGCVESYFCAIASRTEASSFDS
jgi:hypothetical protein